MCACISETVCVRAYASLCAWVYVWASACRLDHGRMHVAFLPLAWTPVQTHTRKALTRAVKSMSPVGRETKRVSEDIRLDRKSLTTECWTVSREHRKWRKTRKQMFLWGLIVCFGVCYNKGPSVTHRQTGRAVMGDAILIVGLPRIPWGRTPGAVTLLLGLLERNTVI